MIDLIKYCNDNGIISFIALGLSILAILMSLHAAKIPFKKKIKLHLQIQSSLSNGKAVPVAYNVNVLNIGNAPISIEYVGFAYKENNKIRRFIDIENPMKHDVVLGINESFDVPYSYVNNPQIEEKRMFLIAQEGCGRVHKLSYRKMKKYEDFITRTSVSDMISAW